MTEISIVKDVPKTKDDVVMSMNNTYSCSEHCDYVVPVAETEPVKYHVVKEQPREDRVIELSYSL